MVCDQLWCEGSMCVVERYGVMDSQGDTIPDLQVLQEDRQTSAVLLHEERTGEDETQDRRS